MVLLGKRIGLRATTGGGPGNDRLGGGKSNDTIVGIAGNDGDDYIDGGAGNDRFGSAISRDVVHGGAGTDVSETLSRGFGSGVERSATSNNGAFASGTSTEIRTVNGQSILTFTKSQDITAKATQSGPDSSLSGFSIVRSTLQRPILGSPSAGSVTQEWDITDSVPNGIIFEFYSNFENPEIQPSLEFSIPLLLP